MGKTKKTHLQKTSLKNTEVRHTIPKCDVYQDIYTLDDNGNEVLYIKQDYFKIIIKEKYNTPVTLVTARGLKFIYRLINKYNLEDEFDVETLLDTAKDMILAKLMKLNLII